ncbi:MAG: dihydroorotate dehydrogenase electron transfer subunit, partial [Patescibacteria group bacterium]|nr:dihydroorotate dehydrogenase electron transfer subunit [Patescibacteria group bacterium]
GFFPITLNRRLTDDIYLLQLAIPEISTIARPGQFIMIRTGDGCSPLLRRPFSILQIDPGVGTIEILLRTVGRGTSMLSRMKPGEKLAVMGPLGNSFPFEGDFKTVLLLAGGIGLPPIYFANRYLTDSGKQLHLYYGTKTGSEQKILSSLAITSIPIHQASEDGSLGYHGFITELLQNDVEQGNIETNSGIRLLGCGPNRMMYHAAKLCQVMNIESYFSIETSMACGIGLCQGCVIPVRSKQSSTVEYKLVCKEGPVFPGEIIAQEEYARSIM